jgi:hypothetical protein
MSTYVSNRDGGQTDEQGHYRFQTKVWSGNVLQGFATSQNSPLGMSVIVSQGDIKINYSSYAYTAFSDSDTVVTITTANGSNPRIDRLVAYIDRGMTPSPLSPNNPNMLKFKVIAGVPGAIPVRPSDSDVNTDVGPSNPWTSLSDILVDTSVTTITNSKITDKRNFVTVGADTVTTPAITNGAVTPAKWANPYKFFAYRSSAWSTNGATAGLVTFNTEDYDTNSNFDTATGKYTAPVDGYYHFSYSIAHSFTNNVQSEIYKNNSSYIKSPQNYNSATFAIGGTSQSFDIKLTAGDYIQIYHYAAPTTTGTASRDTNFSGYLVSQT